MIQSQTHFRQQIPAKSSSPGHTAAASSPMMWPLSRTLAYARFCRSPNRLVLWINKICFAPGGMAETPFWDQPPSWCRSLPIHGVSKNGAWEHKHKPVNRTHDNGLSLGSGNGQGASVTGFQDENGSLAPSAWINLSQPPMQSC